MPKPPHPSSAHSRSIGFYAAVAIGIFSLGLIAFVVIRAATAPTPEVTDGEFDGAEGAFDSNTTDVGNPVRGATGLHIQIMDRNDRTRLSAELHSATIDPIRSQRYRVTKPKALIFLKDGRTVVITSKDGMLLMPDRAQAPEAGTLTGDVLLRLYDATPSARRIDPDTDTPALIWKGQTLTFDSTLGEASTNKPFTLTSRKFEFRADDAKLLINQTLERLERFSVRSGGTLLYHQNLPPLTAPPTAPAPAQADQVASSTNQAQSPPLAPEENTAADAATPAPAQPVITFYKAAFRDSIALTLNAQEIHSDRLDLFARTIDNKLPDDAIAQGSPQQQDSLELAADNTPSSDDLAELSPSRTPALSTPKTTSTLPDTTALADDAPVETSDGQTPDQATKTDDITLTWTGALDVRPLANQPTELANDDILARFSSEQSGVVNFTDTVSQGQGQAAIVEYGMTSQLLVLTGPAQENIMLTSPSMGQARMGRLAFSLATGIAHVSGPGSLIAANNHGRVDWREQADLTFKMQNNRVVGQLIEAMCAGGTKASNDGATIEADFLHAFFDTTPENQSVLTRVIAKTTVTLDDGKGSGGTCDTLDVAFWQIDNKPQPHTVEATGKVNFHKPGSKVVSNHLYAVLRATESNPTDLARVWADGDVDFRRTVDQIKIHAAQLFADTQRQFLEVKGFPLESRSSTDSTADSSTTTPTTPTTPTTDATDASKSVPVIAQFIDTQVDTEPHDAQAAEPDDRATLASVARGKTSITGELVRLHGLDRAVEVFGAGSFEHGAGRGETESHIQASWTQGMAYDDIAGTLECLGDIQAISQPDPFTRDSIQAQALRVWLEPTSLASESSESPDADAFDQADPFKFQSDRPIRRVYAASGLFFGTNDQLAQIESARFARPIINNTPTLEQAMRLQGTEIFAQNAAGTLDVPGKGHLLIADLRQKQVSTDSPDTPTNTDADTTQPLDSNRGAALFDWTESFHADRAQGTADMQGKVHMDHTATATNTQTQLDCANLKIRFAADTAEKATPTSPTDQSTLGGLRAVIAQTDVYFRTDTREVTADLLDYEPDVGIAKALALGTSRVHILDLATGSPMSASALIWNLTTDQVDIVDPSTITMPRLK